MSSFCIVFLVTMCTSTLAQRPPYAGLRPIGYPELVDKPTVAPVVNQLGNRFGEGDVTTQRLPLEALGDRDLVDRLSKLPVDQQPFWLLNWQALEDQRKNPQSYPQKPNDFIDQFIPSTSRPLGNNNLQTTNQLNNRFGESSTSGSQNNVNSVQTTTTMRAFLDYRPNSNGHLVNNMQSANAYINSFGNYVDKSTQNPINNVQSSNTVNNFSPSATLDTANNLNQSTSDSIQSANNLNNRFGQGPSNNKQIASNRYPYFPYYMFSPGTF